MFLLTRVDIADYLSILITIYSFLIFIRILLSWFSSMPYNQTLRSLIQFVHDVTEPYLSIFRRLIPPIGGPAFALDLSPIVALLVLQLGGRFLINLIIG